MRELIRADANRNNRTDRAYGLSPRLFLSDHPCRAVGFTKAKAALTSRTVDHPQISLFYAGVLIGMGIGEVLNYMFLKTLGQAYHV